MLSHLHVGAMKDAILQGCNRRARGAGDLRVLLSVSVMQEVNNKKSEDDNTAVGLVG